jgi:ketosteroid isomerase-like protein
MSQDNVVAVEDAYEAFARGGLDRFLDHWTDDLDHRSIAGAPDDRGPSHGKDQMRTYVQDWIETFEAFMIEPSHRSRSRSAFKKNLPCSGSLEY